MPLNNLMKPSGNNKGQRERQREREKKNLFVRNVDPEL